MSNEEAIGTWEVTGTCFDAETWEVVVEYETATFQVVAPPTRPATDPPVTNPPAVQPSTPTTAGPVAPQPAEPAKPVTANPDFTG